MSECNACFYSGYDECDPAEFYNTRDVKARKDYKCCECGEPILKGTVHNVAVGKWNGELSTYRTCCACEEIRTTFACEGWIFGQLWEDVTEGMFENMTTGCLEKLKTAAAKQKLLDEWNDWKFSR